MEKVLRFSKITKLSVIFSVIMAMAFGQLGKAQCSASIGNITVNPGYVDAPIGNNGNTYNVAEFTSIVFSAKGYTLPAAQTGCTPTYGYIVFTKAPTFPISVASINKAATNTAGTFPQIVTATIKNGIASYKDSSISSNPQGQSYHFRGHDSLFFVPIVVNCGKKITDSCYQIGTTYYKVNYLKTLAGFCSTCANPSCPVDSAVSKVSAADGVQLLEAKMALGGQSNAGNLMNITVAAGTSQSICVPVVVVPGSATFGVMQLDSQSPDGCLDTTNGDNFSYTLLPAGKCNGTPVAPTRKNANAFQSGFNPEWDNLTPGNYTLCYKVTINAKNQCQNFLLQRAGYYNYVGASCTANLGTNTVSGPGVTAVQGQTNAYNLPAGDSVMFTTTGFVLPPNGGTGACVSSYGYAVFTQDPSALVPFTQATLNSAPGFKGITLGSGPNGLVSDNNVGGSSVSIKGSKTLWFVPVVVDCAIDPNTSLHNFDYNGDNCYLIGSSVYKINYISAISNCTANIGTLKIAGNGVTPVTGQPNVYNLADGDTASFTASGFVLPPNGGTGACVSTYGYAVFNQDPSASKPFTQANLNTIPGYKGIALGSGPNALMQDNNIGGFSKSVGGNNALWFVPVLLDCGKDPGTLMPNFDANGDSCYAIGSTVYKVNYLTANCKASAGTVTVTGATPVAGQPNTYDFYSGTLTLTDKGYTLPPNGGTSPCVAGVIYAVFSQDPSSYYPLDTTKLRTIPGYLGISQTGGTTPVGVLTDGITATGQSTSAPFSTLWYVPAVVDCIDDGSGFGSPVSDFDANADNCYAIGSTAIKVNYLVKPGCETNKQFNTLDWNLALTGGNPMPILPTNLAFTCTSPIDTIYKYPYQVIDTISYAKSEDITGLYMRLASTAGSQNATSISFVVNGKNYDYYGATNNPAYPLNWGPIFGYPNYENIMEPYLPAGAKVQITICDTRATPQPMDYYIMDYATGTMIASGTANPSAGNCYVINVTLASPKMTWAIDGDTTRMHNLQNGSAYFDPKTFSTGSHTITYTFNNGAGCTLTAIKTFSVTAGPKLTTKVTNQPCNSTNQGAITATATGGKANYTYSWSNNKTGATITGLSSGTYTVTVKDANGCTTTSTATVNDSPIPAVIVQTSVNPTCAGLTNGSAQAYAYNGTAPYTYAWSVANNTTDSISQMGGGTYTVTVTDANGCSANTTIQLVTPTAYVISEKVTQANCNQTNGVAIVNVSGATPPYVYTWAKAAGTFFDSSATNLSAGTYSVTITDASGCIKTDALVVGSQNGTQLTMGPIKSIKCFGGVSDTVYAVVTGGLSPYNYTWSTSTSGTTKDTAKIGGLHAGNYTLTVVDGNNCANTLPFTINQPTAGISLTDSVFPAVCGNPNGAIKVFVNGGTPKYTYSWSTSATDSVIKGLNANQGYTVTVTDVNGCSSTLTMRDTVIAPPQAAIQTTTNPSCVGGANGSMGVVAYQGTTPYTYNWNTTPAQNGATATNLKAGTYTVTITDANGCTTSVFQELTDPSVTSPFVVTDSMIPYKTCNGTTTGSITVKASGGGQGAYTFAWSNNADTGRVHIGLTPGLYTYTVTDANGCAISKTDSVKNAPIISSVAIIAPFASTACFGTTGSISAQVNGGLPSFSYAWAGTGLSAPTTATLNNIGSGTYSLTVTDANGCSNTTSTTITLPTAPLSLTGNGSIVRLITCGSDTGTIAIYPAGGMPNYTYTWNNNVTTAAQTGLLSGLYSVTVTDANGCVTSATNINLPKSNAMSASINVTNAPTCRNNDGVATVAVTGGVGLVYTYSWSPVTGTSNVLSGLGSAQTLTVVVTDSLGCKQTVNGQMPNTVPVVAFNLNGNGNESICNRNPDTLKPQVSNGTAAYTYSWNTGIVTSDPNANYVVTPTVGNTTTYTITVTDAKGCASDATTMAVRVNPAPIPTIVSDAPQAGGCGTPYEVNFTNVPAAAGNGYKQTWYFGPKDSLVTSTPSTSFKHTFKDTGTYYITLAIDSAGCHASTGKTAYKVVVKPKPVAKYNYAPTDLLTTSVPVTFIDLTTNKNWRQWDFQDTAKDTPNLVGDSTPVHTFKYAGTYCVVLRTANKYNCTDTTVNCIKVADECKWPISVPNVFSPNGDGHNDDFILEATGFSSIHCTILNRWGNTIKTYDALNGKWDGKTNGGEHAPEATYYFIFEGTCAVGGKKMENKGFINLVR